MTPSGTAFLSDFTVDTVVVVVEVVVVGLVLVFLTSSGLASFLIVVGAVAGFGVASTCLFLSSCSTGTCASQSDKY